MKKIFVIDWAMLPTFILTAYTGIKLHVAGGQASHEVWHDRAAAHVVCSLAFLVTAIMHISTHRGWYRSRFRFGLDKKSRVTEWLTILFLFTAATGITLLPVEGAGTRLGHWHYAAALIATIVSVGHTLKRLPTLLKSLRR